MAKGESKVPADVKAFADKVEKATNQFAKRNGYMVNPDLKPLSKKGERVQELLRETGKNDAFMAREFAKLAAIILEENIGSTGVGSVNHVRWACIVPIVAHLGGHNFPLNRPIMTLDETNNGRFFATNGGNNTLTRSKTHLRPAIREEIIEVVTKFLAD